MTSRDDITACGLVIRPHEHVVVVDGNEVGLTSREFEIVMRLVEHPGWVFSAEQLASDEDAVDHSPEAVSVLVSRLRHKLAEAGAPSCVETVRGLGYRLRPPRAGESVSEGAEDAGAGRLRDASWRLQEAVMEVDHFGSESQREIAADALEVARRTISEVGVEAGQRS